MSSYEIRRNQVVVTHLSDNQPLYRFLADEHAHGLVTVGSIRLGTHFDFRRDEVHGLARGDPTEADPDATLVIDHMVITTEAPPPPFLQRHFGFQPDAPVTINDSIFETIEDDRDYYAYCMSAFAPVSLFRRFRCDGCVRIDRPLSFFLALSRALTDLIAEDNTGPVGSMRPVTYGVRRGPYTPVFEHPGMYVKNPRFAYQREVRMLWTPRSASPHPEKLHCPDLTALCSLVYASRRTHHPPPEQSTMPDISTPDRSDDPVDAEKTRRRTLVASLRRGVVEMVSAVSNSSVGAARAADGSAAQQSTVFDSVVVLGSGFFADSRGVVLTAAGIVNEYVRLRAFAEESHAPTPALYVRCTAEPQVREQDTGRMLSWDVTMMACDEVYRCHNTDLAAVRVITLDDQRAKWIHPLTLTVSPCEDGDEVVACGFATQSDDRQPSTRELPPFVTFAYGAVSAGFKFGDIDAPELRQFFGVDVRCVLGMSDGPIVDLATGLVTGVVASRNGRSGSPAVVESLGSLDMGAPPTGTWGAYIHHVVNGIEIVATKPRTPPMMNG